MRAPDRDKGQVRAWRIVPPDPVALADHQGSLRCWVLNGPFHAAWEWWQISVIHLRDISGVKPAHKHYPEAEFEFLIVSLNPERGIPDVDAVERGEDWGDTGEAKFLMPPDATVQFHGVTDEQAASICDDAIEAILTGSISPDSDYRSVWERVIPATVDHYRQGRH